MKESYGRPFFVCAEKEKGCSLILDVSRQSWNGKTILL
jgi:hypothetical protein